MALHDGEFPIDQTLVSELLIAQTPEWSELPLRRFETTGTVNVVYRLGNDKLIRLPRTAQFADGPLREARWLGAATGASGWQRPTGCSATGQRNFRTT